ncbi:hypothetical protein ABC383_06115 [Noviherbaspirillum sp. 1P10PC]|uniref:hypothetical protein n=1 Tax=Noviherbaspirillum sp. 1P10PC TaxID=3132292 RepID=UPI00399F5490
MTRFLKYALVWFIALALPVQGFAAATMLCCGSNQMMSALNQTHHSSARVAKALDIGADHVVVKVQSTALHHDSATGGASVEMGHSPGAKVDKTAKCSHCAASCFGMAVVPEPLNEMPTLEPPGLTVGSFYPSQFTGHIPGTPQRPPLFSLL